MRQGENAVFEILDRRTSLAGNQIKIVAAASSAMRWSSSSIPAAGF
jgi:hypothetical protein